MPRCSSMPKTRYMQQLIVTAWSTPFASCLSSLSHYGIIIIILLEASRQNNVHADSWHGKMNRNSQYKYNTYKYSTSTRTLCSRVTNDKCTTSVPYGDQTKKEDLHILRFHFCGRTSICDGILHLNLYGFSIALCVTLTPTSVSCRAMSRTSQRQDDDGWWPLSFASDGSSPPTIIDCPISFCITYCLKYIL